jgi:tetratricopeptide (TPR) repeat protein
MVGGLKTDHCLLNTFIPMIRFIKAWLVYTWGGLHRYFGNENSMSSEHERAVHYFARAYEIDPTFREARLQRAILLFRELGRSSEALAEFDALLADDPEYGRALFNRGLLLQDIGRYAEALTSLETYLQLPERGEYWTEANQITVLLREIANDSPLSTP